jgi:hypothetical protein
MNVKHELENDIKQMKFDDLIVGSFEKAKESSRRKNIVLDEGGVYLTFKTIKDGHDVFGEFVCWVDDEFEEDYRTVKTACLNTIAELYSESDDELIAIIDNGSLLLPFTPYD